MPDPTQRGASRPPHPTRSMFRKMKHVLEGEVWLMRLENTHHLRDHTPPPSKDGSGFVAERSDMSGCRNAKVTPRSFLIFIE